MDAALLERWIQSRDAEAFRDLALKYLPMVHATCARILRDPAEAEDVTQECFEKLAQIRGNAPQYVGPWLHRVATNRSLSLLRKRATRDRFAEHAARTEEPAVAPQIDDMYSIVDAAIADLPDNLKAPLIAHFFENQSHEAIAQSLGVTRFPAVTHRIGRAIDQVREKLRKKGFELQAVGLLASLDDIRTATVEVPATLAQVIAKLAISGGAVARVSGTVGWTTLKTFLGALAMTSTQKTVFVALAFVLAILAPMEIYRRSLPTPPPSPATSTPVETHRADVIDEQKDDHTATPNPVPSQSSDVAAVAPASISGSAINEDLTPLAGARVLAYRGGSVAGTSSTDSNGAFNFASLAPGDYGIHVSIPNDALSEPIERAVVRLRPGQAITGLTIRCGADAFTISGRITNKDGDGIPKAYASIDWGSQHFTAQSDASGFYLFTGLPKGLFDISVSVPPGFVRQSDGKFKPDSAGPKYMFVTLKDVAVGSTNADIVVPDAVHIRGRVVSASTGKPITRYRIGLTDEIDPVESAGKLLHEPEPKEVNDLRGEFDIAAREGEQFVIAKSDSSLVGSAPVNVVVGETPPVVEIALQEGVTVQGAVRTSAHLPIIGAKIYFGGEGQLPGGSPSTGLVATTGSRGRFEIAGLEPDRKQYIEVVHKLGRKSVEFDVHPDKNPWLDVVMDTPGIVMGKVLYDGRPVWHANVSLNGSAPQLTGNDGAYRFDSVEPDRSRVNVSLPRQGNPANAPQQVSRSVDVEPGKTAILDFNLVPGYGELRGTITSGDSSDRFRITASCRDGEQLVSLDSRITADGSYQIEHIPAGEVRIYVSAAEPRKLSHIYKIPIAEHEKLVRDFEFDSNTSLVCDVVNNPDDMWVTLELCEGDRDYFKDDRLAYHNAMACCDSLKGSGQIELSGLEPGHYTAVLRLNSASDEQNKALQTTLDVREGEDTQINFEVP